MSVEVRPGEDVEVLAVLNDHPATPVPGGLQLALGDAWGGDHRRIVLRLANPAVAELGPRKVADVRIRWTDVTGVPALRERTLPVLVNVAPGESIGDGDVGASSELLSATTWTSRSSKDLHDRSRKTTRRRKP